MNMAYAIVLPLGVSCPCTHDSLMFRNVVVVLRRHLASYLFLCSSNGMRDSPIARCTSSCAQVVSIAEFKNRLVVSLWL